ncbi:hypothetical protein L7F22_039285 [Adiantum nelumboides]|nr:hypothetical protein [Adiantum nelumboides]
MNAMSPHKEDEDGRASSKRQRRNSSHDDDLRQALHLGIDAIDSGGMKAGTELKEENLETMKSDSGELTPLQSIDSNIELQRPTNGLISRNSNSSDTSTSSTDSKGRPRESMYPEIFGEMISTVLEHEAYLFTTSERILLESFANMDYEARHLLARLIQRRNTWHRVDKLRYDFEVKDKAIAVSSLCQPNKDILAIDQEDEDNDITRFCLSEQDMDEGFEEPLNLLTLAELKELAKNMNRLKGVTTKASIISSLLTTKSQGTLHGFGDKNSNEVRSQAAVLREQLATIVGGCVKVCPKAQYLIDRIALVYYRGAELGTSALTTAVLSKSRKRAYPDYVWKRSEKLFASRRHLVEMQNALQLELQMDQWIEWDGSRDAIAKAMDAFELVYERWKEAVCEGEALAKNSYDLGAYNRMRFHPGWPLTRVVYKGVYVLGRSHKHEREAEVLRALLGQRVFRRGRRGDWYDRLALITSNYPPSTTPNAIRKAKREALAISVQGIEDRDTHLIYQDTLQRRITRLENQLNLPFSEKHDFSYAKLRKCEERIFRGVRLDKMMEEKKGIFGSTIPIPGEKERRSMSRDTSASDQYSFKYRTPLRKVVKVERVELKAEEVKQEDENDDGTPTNDQEESPKSKYSIERRDVRKDMHSVWRGLDGQPCRVENLVLQHYEKQNFKGFHCEGGVLTMLFALVMWDILFMHVDGVFETPYQRQPLDILEDSFAIVRGPALRERLVEIENTGGLNFIKQTDDRERERKTWAIGCKWDLYTQEDLLEIAECMGGKALSVICQMLAEEWSHCTSGMPDLVVWRYGDKQVRFCEVKGPGDKLSDKQKLWIDVLLRAGLRVEVSKVEEQK